MLGKRGSRISSSVFMKETSLALRFIFDDEMIDGVRGIVGLKSSTLFIVIGTNKFLNSRMFKIFIHT